MSKVKKFLDFFDYLILNCKESVVMPDEVKDFYEMLKSQESSAAEKPLFTETGIQILEYMQNQESSNLKAKDIALGMDVSSRKVSGSMRKLVTDGFVDKFGKDPVIYSLTNQGKSFNIQAYKEENCVNE